jgi:hypothetical protein
MFGMNPLEKMCGCSRSEAQGHEHGERGDSQCGAYDASQGSFPGWTVQADEAGRFPDFPAHVVFKFKYAVNHGGLLRFWRVCLSLRGSTMAPQRFVSNIVFIGF